MYRKFRENPSSVDPFELLRRHRPDGIHRPLIVFTPKSVLRNKAAVSDIRDFTEQKFPLGAGGTDLHRR